MSAPQVRVIGRYEVIGLLGHGGAGDVYLARDQRLERNVAIKLLHAGDQRGLADEAKALAALDHPGIVAIHEIGEHEGREFIALEYLPGRSLRELIAAKAPRDELVAVCAQVAHAVAAAHRANLLHGDIKPENVIVGDDGHVKVVDFGLASRIDEAERRTPRAVTAHAQLAKELEHTLPPTTPPADTIHDAGVPALWGTPSYMAPELLIGVAPTRASDVYSLGVVLYECLTGARPHDAQTIVEAIALVVDGPPARIADPRGPLLESMLGHDRRARPPLTEVARRLDEERTPAPPAAVKPRRVWPWIALAFLAVASALAFVALRSNDRASAPVTVAVMPPVIELATYGVEPPDTLAYGDVLVALLDDADAVGGIAARGDDALAAATTAGATHVLETRIAQRGTELHATVTITTVATRQRAAPIEVTRSDGEVPALVHDIAETTARATSSRARLAAINGPRRAAALYRIGKDSLDRGLFTKARPLLEQAAAEDPALFDAWYGLAITLAWMQAPDARIIAAARAAEALAPEGSKRELVRGLALFVGGEFTAAREKLAAIELDKSATAPDQRDLLYYSGEANWHDGRHAAGFAYFKEALKRDLSFGAAAVHPWQFAIATRNAELASYYAALAHQSVEWTDFSLGNHAKLSHSDDPGVKLSAQLALGITSSPEITAKTSESTFEAGTLRIALALAANDSRTASAELTTLIPKLDSASPLDLESLGDVVLAGELRDGIPPLVTAFEKRGVANPSRRDRRFATLAAAVMRTPVLVLDGGTDRDRRRATAVRAELAADPATAIAILTALVADPSVHWDYAERAALLRNLRATDDQAARGAVCEDTLRPAVPRPAMVVMRRLCSTEASVPPP